MNITEACIFGNMSVDPNLRKGLSKLYAQMENRRNPKTEHTQKQPEFYKCVRCRKTVKTNLIVRYSYETIIKGEAVERYQNFCPDCSEKYEIYLEKKKEAEDE